MGSIRRHRDAQKPKNNANIRMSRGSRAEAQSLRGRLSLPSRSSGPAAPAFPPGFARSLARSQKLSARPGAEKLWFPSVRQPTIAGRAVTASSVAPAQCFLDQNIPANTPGHLQCPDQHGTPLRNKHGDHHRDPHGPIAFGASRRGIGTDSKKLSRPIVPARDES